MKIAFAVLETDKGVELLSHGLPDKVIAAYKECTKPGKAYLYLPGQPDRTKRIAAEPEPVAKKGKAAK